MSIAEYKRQVDRIEAELIGYTDLTSATVTDLWERHTDMRRRLYDAVDDELERLAAELREVRAAHETNREYISKMRESVVRLWKDIQRSA